MLARAVFAAVAAAHICKGSRIARAVANNTKAGCAEIMVFGDWGFPGHQKEVIPGLCRVAKKTNPDVVVSVGDQMYLDRRMTKDDMDKYFNDLYVASYQSLRVPWWCVLGNADWDHKTMVSSQLEYTKQNKYWEMDYYYFKKTLKKTGVTIDVFFHDSQIEKQIGEVKSVLGTTKMQQVRSEQRAWMEAELGKSTADWKILVSHYNPRYYSLSKGILGKTDTGYLRELMKRHGASMHFGGHMHDKHIILDDDGITYLVSGAGNTKYSKITNNPKKIPKISKVPAFYNDPGCATVTFCSGSEATIKLWGVHGDQQHEQKVGNKVSQLSVEEGAEEYANTCHGLEMMGSMRECPEHECIVVSKISADETCAEFCASSGLSCVTGWSNAGEECGAEYQREELGCDGSPGGERMSYVKCQCGEPLS